MKLDEIVDEIIVMNLDRRTDRLNHCVAQADQHNFSFIRLKATDWKDLHYIPKGFRLGEFALNQTYLNALDYCISKDFNTVLIMEDDFDFCENLEERLDEIKQIPDDWDLIYLGANHYHLGAGTIPPEKINDNILKVKSSFCAHAIIYNRKMLTEIRDRLSKSDCVVDLMLSRLQPDFNCYGFVKNICKQYDSHSDLINFNPHYNSKGIFD